MTINRRYGMIAPFYDAISGEWPIYRIGRIAGIRALKLKAGDRVLDLGCGTGLNFSLLHEAVGEEGLIVGIDISGEMLERGRARTARQGWANIELVQADATTVGRGKLTELLDRGASPDSAVAVLFTYALSLMPDWPNAWRTGMGVCQPGERLAVVDVGVPQGSTRVVLGPLARLACRVGGADIAAHPWRAVEQDCAHVEAWNLRRLHIQVRAGAKRRDAEPPAADHCLRGGT